MTELKLSAVGKQNSVSLKKEIDAVEDLLLDDFSFDDNTDDDDYMGSEDNDDV